MDRHDRLIQGLAAGGDFRILAAQTTRSISDVRDRLDLSPVAATALGRAMTGSVLLARLLDKHYRNQKVVLRFEGGGPLGVLIAEGSVSGTMRGYVDTKDYDDPSLNVGRAVGSEGMLTVIRGTPPDGRPYTSQVRLANGEIATDITHYLDSSEQIASAVLLGVMTRPSGISSAGGMIIQAFPHAPRPIVAKVEELVRNAPPLSTLLDRMPIENAVEEILKGVDYKHIDPVYNVPLAYRCSCTRQRAFAPFALFDRSELQEMIDQGGSEVVCEYCGQKYNFSTEELRAVSSAEVLDAPLTDSTSH